MIDPLCSDVEGQLWPLEARQVRPKCAETQVHFISENQYICISVRYISISAGETQVSRGSGVSELSPPYIMTDQHISWYITLLSLAYNQSMPINATTSY